MKNIDECLYLLNNILDRPTLEDYIERHWIRPVRWERKWYFEGIDIARIRLVYQLHHEMQVNNNAIDIILSLLDQFYGLHSQFNSITEAIQRQPLKVQTEISAFLSQRQYPENFKKGAKL